MYSTPTDRKPNEKIVTAHTQGKSALSMSSEHRSKRQPLEKQSSIFVNFFAGAVGGTAGVLITGPLDVVQTRLQSSLVTLRSPLPSSRSTSITGRVVTSEAPSRVPSFGLNVLNYMSYIAKKEGIPGLYKGILPNLVAIAPSRALYFGMYTKSKAFLSGTFLMDSSVTVNHMLSALFASWSVSTMTNPIWFMKTRLQLDLNAHGQRRKLMDIIREVFHKDGIQGFYRGLSASYIGASETMIYFVIYEKLKSAIAEQSSDNGTLLATDYVLASFFSKIFATVSVYPHEVVRTRLRQGYDKFGSKKAAYNGFFQTLRKVYTEERWLGLYGGMGAHLMRQVPNTVIMFLTYEMIVNFFSQE